MAKRLVRSNIIIFNPLKDITKFSHLTLPIIALNSIHKE